jgi:thiol:disulfide interchange protein DsbC
VKARPAGLCSAVVLVLLAAVLLQPWLAQAGSLEETAQRLFPQSRVDAVEPTPIPNLYEVRSGRSLVYMDGSGRYVFVGELYDFTTRRNLTAETLLVLNAVNLQDLPSADAIHLGSAQPTKRLALFEDVDCPFCRKFHAEVLPKLLQDGVGVDVFLLPILQLHPHAELKSKAVWCSPDRVAALSAALDGTLPGDLRTDCATPLADIAALAKKLGIQGTPTFVLDTGLRLDGYLAYDAFMARWRASAKK